MENSFTRSTIVDALHGIWLFYLRWSQLLHFHDDHSERPPAFATTARGCAARIFRPLDGVLLSSPGHALLCGTDCRERRPLLQWTSDAAGHGCVSTMRGFSTIHLTIQRYQFQ